jgi:hypothetical protein
MLAGVNPAFDRPVILFKDSLRYCAGRRRQFSFRVASAFKLHDGWRITGVLVGVDYPRRLMVRFGETAQSAATL